MQIGSGHSPLSLAVLKVLGAPSATPAAGATASAGAVTASAASPAASPVASAPQVPATKPAVAARPTADGNLLGGAGDLGVARNIPRGSFVNLRV